VTRARIAVTRHSWSSRARRLVAWMAERVEEEKQRA
jgi:hypothetical protein